MKVIKDDIRLRVESDGFFVVKHYKNLSKEDNNALLGKLERKDDLKQIKGFVVPIDYTLKNGTVDEIYSKFINYPDFISATFSCNPKFFLDSSSAKMLSFETISKCFENINKTLKQGHDKEVVFLDFVSNGNIKYNPKTFETYILDYEDCQIGNNYAFAWTTPFEKNSLSHTKKYRKGRFFTKDSDIYLLIDRWFGYCTMSGLNNFGMDASTTLNFYGLDDKEISRKIKLCYNQKCKNEYFDEDFMRIYSNYTLEEDPYDVGRAFVKK